MITKLIKAWLQIPSNEQVENLITDKLSRGIPRKITEIIHDTTMKTLEKMNDEPAEVYTTKSKLEQTLYRANYDTVVEQVKNIVNKEQFIKDIVQRINDTQVKLK